MGERAPRVVDRLVAAASHVGRRHGRGGNPPRARSRAPPQEPPRLRGLLSRTEHRFASWRQGSPTSARSCAASGRDSAYPRLSARQLKSLAGNARLFALESPRTRAATAAGGPGFQGRVERVGGDSSGGGRGVKARAQGCFPGLARAGRPRSSRRRRRAPSPLPPCRKAVAKASLPHFHWEQRPGSQSPRPQTTGLVRCERPHTRGGDDRNPATAVVAGSGIRPADDLDEASGLKPLERLEHRGAAESALRARACRSTRCRPPANGLAAPPPPCSGRPARSGWTGARTCTSLEG